MPPLRRWQGLTELPMSHLPLPSCAIRFHDEEALNFVKGPFSATMKKTMRPLPSCHPRATEGSFVCSALHPGCVMTLTSQLESCVQAVWVSNFLWCPCLLYGLMPATQTVFRSGPTAPLLTAELSRMGCCLCMFSRVHQGGFVVLGPSVCGRICL